MEAFLFGVRRESLLSNLSSDEKKEKFTSALTDFLEKIQFRPQQQQGSKPHQSMQTILNTLRTAIKSQQQETEHLEGECKRLREQKRRNTHEISLLHGQYAAAVDRLSQDGSTGSVNDSQVSSLVLSLAQANRRLRQELGSLQY